MMQVAPGLPWSQPGWRARAQAWIEALVDAPAGHAQEVKIRPWSAVLRQPTATGDVYFKANLPALANEPALTRVLHRICPEHVLGVLADDPGEGWMLQADGGPTLASLLGGSDDVDRLERMLAVYAEVQVRAARHVDELLAAGAPDRRLPQLRALFEELVAGRRPELLRLAGRLGDLADELDAYGLPATIDHSDLHAGNVLAPGDRDCGSPAELRSALDLALRLGPITRALAWNRVLAGLPPDAAGDWGDALDAWLRDLETELAQP
jgi:hypothetical protein